jgi:hypothetical protein
MGITNFLLFCSGVSREILYKCPESEVIKHSSIGASVLFTAILAAVSSHFAFSLIVDSFWIVTGLALFWGLIIFNLDRYIVSTLRKKGDFFLELIQISPRIILSVTIALVIAKPLELQIFKSEIEQDLYEKLNRNIAILEKKYQERTAALDFEKKQLSDELRGYFELKESYYQEYRCECDGTCGTGRAGGGRECFRKKKKYDDFILEYQSKEASITESFLQVEQNKALEFGFFQEDKDRLNANFSYGLLARIQALNNLGGWETWTVTLLILLIEIAPVLTKLFASRGPYDELLAIEDTNFKYDYIKSLYQSTSIGLDQDYGYKLQEINLIKKEHQAEKQKKVKDLYQDLRQELSKQLGK